MKKKSLIITQAIVIFRLSSVSILLSHKDIFTEFFFLLNLRLKWKTFDQTAAILERKLFLVNTYALAASFLWERRFSCFKMTFYLMTDYVVIKKEVTLGSKHFSNVRSEELFAINVFSSKQSCLKELWNCILCIFACCHYFVQYGFI